MKQIISCIVLSLFIFSGCTTRTTSEKIFLNGDTEDIPFQTPVFKIDDYKSPEFRNPKQKTNVSVAVAISGGGHRAGNFGIGVLRELEAISCNGKTINILNELDYFSTVSGGGIAAGVYISTLYDYIDSGEEDYSFNKIIKNNRQDLRRNIEVGYHHILFAGLLDPRSLWNNDRGDFLERAFDKKILGSNKRGRSLTLGDVFLPTDSDKPLLPMWITNSTVYENGSIFPFLPMTLKKYKITKYTHHLKKYDIDEKYETLPLAVGIKASASFPVAVPATTLESEYDGNNLFLHLFDGGLADNLGVYSALQMLSQTGENEKVLIIIDAYTGQPEPFSKQEGSPAFWQIWLRSTGISLDAWRIRHRHSIEQLSSSGVFNGKKVRVIYLSFDNLEKSLKEKIKDIGTNFNITEEQQDTLFKAAKKVVEDNQDSIVRAIIGESCPNQNGSNRRTGQSDS